MEEGAKWQVVNHGLIFHLVAATTLAMKQNQSERSISVISLMKEPLSPFMAMATMWHID